MDMNKTHQIIGFVVIGLIATIILRSLDTRQNYRPKMVSGGLYSVYGGGGKYGVTKLLAFADGIVHVRLYKNKYDHRPNDVAVNTLSLGTINDTDGVGIGHMPVTEKEFLSWSPHLIKVTKLTEEELEGYNSWKESGSEGAFDSKIMEQLEKAMHQKQKLP